MAGVEADCRLELVMASGVTGTVELSRTRHMRNSVVIHFERATLEVALARNMVSIHWGDATLAMSGAVGPRRRSVGGRSCEGAPRRSKTCS